MAGFDLIIFDCDGVVVDSEIIAAQMEARLLSEAGFTIDAQDLAERFAGMMWKDILLAVEKEANIPLQASLLDKPEKDEVMVEVRKWNSRASFPTVVIDDKDSVAGFKEARLKELLGI